MAAPELDRDVVAEVRVPMLITIATAATILGRSPKTIRRRIAEGSLPAVVENEQLMIRGDELRAYIDSLSRPGAPTVRRSRRQGSSPYAKLA